METRVCLVSRDYARILVLIFLWLRTTALGDQKPYLVVHVSRKLFCWGEAVETLIRGYVPAVHHRLVLLSSDEK